MRRPTAVLGAGFTAALTTGLTAAGFLIVTASPVSAAVSIHNPFGALDRATLTGSTVNFSGWAADRDLSGTVRISITLDKVPVRSVLANGLRADVARAIPSVGSYRGYSGSVPVPTGRHSICAIAVNLGAGASTSFRCVTVTVAGEGAATAVVKTRAPFGHVDSLSYAKGIVSVSGWSIDPDTTAPDLIDVAVNGANIGSLLASGNRPDVARVYRSSGAKHGLVGKLSTTLAAGNYSICVTAINTAAGVDGSLGCRIYTVLPVGEPAALNTATAAAAAVAMQNRAIATHAAKASDFPAAATSAGRIAIAARALLQQATGRRTVPPAQPTLPKFAAASTTKAPDVQSVMGAKPALGTFPQVKKAGRAGVAHSLEVYRSDPRSASPGAGAGIVGAAAILPANGRTVHPATPAYPAGYTKLRAEVALDAALAHLGDSYVWAASGPSTFDCSGLTQWAYAKAGISLMHYTGSQAVQGVRVQSNQLLPGDLVLFGSDLHHVGMYLGAGYMVDAPYTGAYVRVDKISSFGDYSLAVRP